MIFMIFIIVFEYNVSQQCCAVYHRCLLTAKNKLWGSGTAHSEAPTISLRY